MSLFRLIINLNKISTPESQNQKFFLFFFQTCIVYDNIFSFFYFHFSRDSNLESSSSAIKSERADYESSLLEDELEEEVGFDLVENELDHEAINRVSAFFQFSLFYFIGLVFGPAIQHIERDH